MNDKRDDNLFEADDHPFFGVHKYASLTDDRLNALASFTSSL